MVTQQFEIADAIDAEVRKRAAEVYLARWGAVTATREEMNAIRSERMAGEPHDERVHFYICKACGQAVDKRRLGDVFHHEEPGHEPIPADS